MTNPIRRSGGYDDASLDNRRLIGRPRFGRGEVKVEDASDDELFELDPGQVICLPDPRPTRDLSGRTLRLMQPAGVSGRTPPRGQPKLMGNEEDLTLFQRPDDLDMGSTQAQLGKYKEHLAKVERVATQLIMSFEAEKEALTEKIGALTGELKTLQTQIQREEAEKKEQRNVLRKEAINTGARRYCEAKEREFNARLEKLKEAIVVPAKKPEEFQVKKGTLLTPDQLDAAKSRFEDTERAKLEQERGTALNELLSTPDFQFIVRKRLEGGGDLLEGFEAGVRRHADIEAVKRHSSDFCADLTRQFLSLFEDATGQFNGFMQESEQRVSQIRDITKIISFIGAPQYQFLVFEGAMENIGHMIDQVSRMQLATAFIRDHECDRLRGTLSESGIESRKVVALRKEAKAILAAHIPTQEGGKSNEEALIGARARLQEVITSVEKGSLAAELGKCGKRLKVLMTPENFTEVGNLRGVEYLKKAQFDREALEKGVGEVEELLEQMEGSGDEFMQKTHASLKGALQQSKALVMALDLVDSQEKKLSPIIIELRLKAAEEFLKQGNDLLLRTVVEQMGGGSASSGLGLVGWLAAVATVGMVGLFVLANKKK